MGNGEDAETETTANVVADGHSDVVDRTDICDSFGAGTVLEGNGSAGASF